MNKNSNENIRQVCFDITFLKYYTKLMSMINILVQSLERDQKYGAGLSASKLFVLCHTKIYTP